MSILPTFYKQHFCTKVFWAAFLYLHFRFVPFCRKEIGSKAACKLLLKLTIGVHDCVGELIKNLTKFLRKVFFQDAKKNILICWVWMCQLKTWTFQPNDFCIQNFNINRNIWSTWWPTIKMVKVRTSWTHTPFRFVCLKDSIALYLNSFRYFVVFYCVAIRRWSAL